MHAQLLLIASSTGVQAGFPVTPRAPPTQHPSSPDSIYRKWGLELALLHSLRDSLREGSSKEVTMQRAGDLFQRYGPAYLLTSISLAGLSYASCYVAVSHGVNFGAALARLGMPAASEGSKKAGRAALAYVAHKAASPLRFPPTVALTPLVARKVFRRQF